MLSGFPEERLRPTGGEQRELFRLQGIRERRDRCYPGASSGTAAWTLISPPRLQRPTVGIGART